MINGSELLKIAKADPEVAEALLTLAKHAEGGEEPTEFKESNPAADESKKEDEGGEETNGNKQPPKEAVPVGPIAQPIPQEAPPAAGDPVSEGARAAQVFMQPAFEAAGQGDENAQKTLAVAAGEVARGVAEASGAGQGEAPAEAPVEGQPVEGQPPVATPANPEGAVADQFVAQPAAAPVAPPAGQPPMGPNPGVMNKQSNDQTVSMDTVIKLVNLAKNNII